MRIFRQSDEEWDEIKLHHIVTMCSVNMVKFHAKWSVYQKSRSAPSNRTKTENSKFLEKTFESLWNFSFLYKCQYIEAFDWTDNEYFFESKVSIKTWTSKKMRIGYIKSRTTIFCCWKYLFSVIVPNSPPWCTCKWRMYISNPFTKCSQIFQCDSTFHRKCHRFTCDNSLWISRN